MQNWWYRVRHMAADPIGDKLNAMLDEMGAHGWELIHVEGTCYIFKCPRESNGARAHDE